MDPNVEFVRQRVEEALVLAHQAYVAILTNAESRGELSAAVFSAVKMLEASLSLVGIDRKGLLASHKLEASDIDELYRKLVQIVGELNSMGEEHEEEGVAEP